MPESWRALVWIRCNRGRDINVTFVQRITNVALSESYGVRLEYHPVTVRVARAVPAVRLLGGPQLVDGAKVHGFAADKRHQLLAYLAYSGDWVSRDRLADLLWSDTSTQLAKQNLRRLLGRTRKLGWVRSLQVERLRVRWQVDTDVARFRQALDAEDWDEALRAYAGPFLSGLDSYDDTEFANWLTLEREHWHNLWRGVSFSRAQQLVLAQRYERAATLLRNILEQDGLDEDALLAYLEVADKAAQGRLALKVFERFQVRLRRELGLEPTAATKRLVERLKGQEAPALTTPEVRPLSHPGTSFIGRELELAEIMNLLGKPSCQLLTLVGPGGVGKTRLAMEAATELADRYSDGAVFVPVEALSSTTALPTAIARALQLPVHDQDNAFDELARFIGSKNLLVVLDNFEHLSAAAIWISNLCKRCANLQVLVTSRERLDLPEAWTLPVEGLAYPTGVGTVTTGDAQSFDAVALFVDRAQRVDPTFVLTKHELRAVLEICRLVQGFPLAIELAAVWVRVMTCADIVRELSEDVDFLTSSPNSGDRRHTSIRAAFEHSWALLTPQEQVSLRRLAVFRGGFNKEAAAMVTGTSIAMLAALVDKSLLRVTAQKRYEIHALLQQFAREKLLQDKSEEAAMHAEHGAYFLALTERAEPELTRPQREHWLRRIDDDYENLLSALAWATSQGNGESVIRLAGSLWRFWWLRGRYREGRAYLERALEHPQAEVPGAARAKALGGLGVLAWGEGDYATARDLFEVSLEVRRKLGDEVGVVDMLNNLAILAHEQGEYARAGALYREALEADLRLGEEEGVASVLGNLASLALDQGDVDAAQRHFEDSLTLCRKLSDKWGVAARLIGLAMVEMRRGNDVRAQACYEEALAIARALKDKNRIGFALRGLGLIALGRGQPDDAQAALQESLSLSRETGDRRAAGYSLQGLGLVSLESGRLGEAQAHLQEALALQRALGDKQGVASSLHALGRLALKRGDIDLADCLFREALDLVAGVQHASVAVCLLEGLAAVAAVRGHPERAIIVWGAAATWREVTGSPQSSHESRQQDPLLADARKQLSSAAVDQAWAKGKALTLKEAIDHASPPHSQTQEP